MPDLEALKQRLLVHWLALYDDPAFGPDYVRDAVRECLRTGAGMFPRIGHEFKEVLDGRVHAEAAK